MKEVKNRDKVIIRTSWISTWGNALLSAAKIVVGITAGSLAVLGDGIDSATDVVISVVMVVTAGIIARPPSQKYVYGYEKAESVATKILSLVLLYAGLQMLIMSVGSLISPEPRQMPQTIAIYVTLFSIVGKLLLSLYQFRQGKRADSPLLVANAVNMRNDVMISAGVLLGLIFTFVLKMPVLDSVTGLIISGFIIYSSVRIFIDSNVELMDGVKDETVYNRIFEAVERVPGASNPHRVRSRLVGGMYVIVLDVEADPDLTLRQAHEIADQVEDNIRDSLKNVYDIMVHVEPRGAAHKAEQFGINRKILKNKQ